MSLDDQPGGDDDAIPDSSADGELDASSGADRPARSHAAYAINWKTVLVLDAAMGLAVVAAGFIALVVWSFWLGAFLIATGCAYTGMVVFRADQWRRLRRDAGL